MKQTIVGGLVVLMLSAGLALPASAARKNHCGVNKSSRSVAASRQRHVRLRQQNKRQHRQRVAANRRQYQRQVRNHRQDYRQSVRNRRARYNAKHQNMNAPAWYRAANTRQWNRSAYRWEPRRSGRSGHKTHRHSSKCGCNHRNHGKTRYARHDHDD